MLLGFSGTLKLLDLNFRNRIPIASSALQRPIPQEALSHFREETGLTHIDLDTLKVRKSQSVL